MTSPPRKPRVDWDAARALYVALGPENRTYRRVAAEFTVSETTVKKWAKRQNWPGVAAKADADAAAKLVAKAGKSLEVRQADTIRVAEKLRDRILDAPLDEIDLAAAIRSLPRYAALEQLFAGEATSRVEIGEVQALVVAIVAAAGEFVPAEARPAFLARIAEVQGGLGLGEAA